jgi:hypothetical protein
MEARSSEPGLDTPQTWQRFAPGRASAPQDLQGKGNAAPSVAQVLLLIIFAGGLITRTQALRPMNASATSYQQIAA